MSKIKKNDVWIIHYPVPYKKTNNLLRPFIILDILNGKFYGIPLTTFSTKRYRKILGDLIISKPFLSNVSIAKPYNITSLSEKFFIEKIGTIQPEIVQNITQSIKERKWEYLSIKNDNALLREYVIESQNQKINLLGLRIQTLEKENKILKNENQLLEQEREITSSTFEFEFE